MSAAVDSSRGSSDRRGYQAWTQALPEGTYKKVVSKLFTNEDSQQLHKTLGALCIASFLYRYFYVLPRTGTLGFDGTWFDHLTILVHMLLSTSSLIFHVLKARIRNRPMIIWEEYRLHAIVFSTRCLSLYLIGYFQPLAGSPYQNLLQGAIIVSHHFVADYITSIYGSKDGTTTVRVHDGHRAEITLVLRFYAFYQFAALASALTPHERLCDLGYNSFIAIQSSAFLMTLYRKSIITEFAHAGWYSACLIISLSYIYMTRASTVFALKLFAVYFLRTKFRVSKYALWTAFIILSLPMVEQAVMNSDSFKSVEALIHTLHMDQWQWLLVMFGIKEM